ncbi:Crp/Fnr family transcriptional regulator [Marivirga atlantica]|jgi:CRP/FNR family cyclic AMP-dependent transcriptional regulator|uniref:Crp/Fnr family transcriptional regulator n=1 Tax=Marivirga atlantica TaxID=1548457 RepID=A0A937AEP8_9BACT|nr:Crp/Fnr family transcriptional regulator [Marivirga atlantica]MBL0764873.1 Crp/Fnr family transcriptional regulator [Marivirga atlantica]
MSTESSIWYFENVDLFNILCPHKLAGLSENHVMNRFKKNEFIYFPNDIPHHVYMIAEGRIKVGSYTNEGKEIVKAILGPGEIFGELALTGEEKRNDFAQALDNDTIVCPMSLNEMKQMMAHNKPLSFKLMKLIGLRLRKVERRLESLVFKDARTRVVEFLKDEAEEKGKKVGYETMIPNHLTHKDIASLTGTSRQTVTTILNDLRDKNIINFDRRKILIRDLEKIA